MILLDFSQVIFGQIAIEFSRNKNNTVEENMLRHMIINQVRALNVKFREKYGRMIIVFDDRHYWRKGVFPYYKAHRKVKRDKSLVDWNTIFEIVDRIKTEIQENLPIPFVQVEAAEADDVISVAACVVGATKPVLIVSSDKDFRQLQFFPFVKQWAPTMDKFLNEADPIDFLRNMIIDGDKGDGIPKLLMPLDSLVNKPTKRVVMTEKRRKELLGYFSYPRQQASSKAMCDVGPIQLSLDCPEAMGERILLNDRLINLTDHERLCPVSDKIMGALGECLMKKPGRSPLFYFNTKGLKQLASKTEDFYVREG